MRLLLAWLTVAAVSCGSPGIPDGQGTCHADADCTSGICVSFTHICGVQPDGNICSLDRDCVSKVCVGQDGRGTCGAGDKGATCYRLVDCKSSDCVARPFENASGMGLCGPNASGEICWKDADCLSGSCGNGSVQVCK